MAQHDPDCRSWTTGKCSPTCGLDALREKAKWYDSKGSGTTHWEGCWKEPRHQECAIAEIERLRAANVKLLDRLTVVRGNEERLRADVDSRTVEIRIPTHVGLDYHFLVEPQLAAEIERLRVDNERLLAECDDLRTVLDLADALVLVLERTCGAKPVWRDEQNALRAAIDDAKEKP